jgi:alkylated DNA repair protein (DNA oxidative demethylase)
VRIRFDGYIGTGFFGCKLAPERRGAIFGRGERMLAVGDFTIHKGYLDPAEQAAMAADVAAVAAAAPFFAPLTPWGKPMSVRMTSAGRYGWFTDRTGYRYIDRHPGGTPWPPIPGSVLAVWRALVSEERLPDCCLVNWYGPRARMGMHRDADEKDFSWPVLSISLGDSALFRMGGAERGDRTTSVLLDSGDVVVFGGAARLAYHGIDRIRAGTSTLLPQGGRINLTLRVVDWPPPRPRRGRG